MSDNYLSVISCHKHLTIKPPYSIQKFAEILVWFG